MSDKDAFAPIILYLQSNSSYVGIVSMISHIFFQRAKSIFSSIPDAQLFEFSEMIDSASLSPKINCISLLFMCFLIY